ncbi:MAG: hypothetical protein DI637_09700 [Citromicrobium sp.]|nr:MAG: hypothetical protein DI637_09700 [Citromicrobium sp.]
MRFLAGLAAAVLVAGCAAVPDARPPLDTGVVAPPPASPGDTAVAAGVAGAPPVESLSIAPADAVAALTAFRASCAKILFRDDASGLTRRVDWQAPCSAAESWTGDARSFFTSQFETVVVGDGNAFATGYYEPEIRGSRVRGPGYTVPVYAIPTDLVRGWPDDMPLSERTGRQPLGRYDEFGRFVPYYERSQIEAGALEGKVPVIAWAADPVEFFFLQIQGSGLLRLPDNSLMRIGYAGQNGREYVGIGSVMRERGLIGEGPGHYPGSMQGIMQYIREHPAEGAELMRLNKSWIFFQSLATDGPLGSLSVPVRRGDSVAVDPKFTPYGAPVWLDLDRNEADGLWIAQDTGGAIKGANRFDTFWGNGADARVIAGGMSGRGRAYVLLPKGTLARLGVR